MRQAREFDKLTTEYEKLRQSMLGHTQHSVGMALFLHQGMARWLRVLTENGSMPCSERDLRACPARSSNDQLVAILADAIIDSAGGGAAEVRP